ncbi:MAG: DegT/DnrJ/EryC1/StrS family aminotransferase [Firmicutes bacterium]|nr:DegT/DnrJ/EryC1/StrS family aminotransferase [Bacillota bacterium]MBR3260597.1 DegT/DnrJ/EryC1/StrS family aminotransferase [Bacillota bacterium]MBR4024758.1 DegT/DnrJ/EryC1/StrS family aminotransferase [Bacillota bacterium]MBR6956737.1 DegT/DnrJ/EryC1/StrS family aminotransferase [Bacillota bacterium]
MQFRDLKKQYEVLKNDIDAGISEVLASAKFISGPQVKELEQKLAEYVGVKHCITCANGTDAITLAMMTWGVKEGDAVFVPDFTFFSSGECPAFEGATPIYVDVDQRTFNLDAVKLEEAILKVKTEGKYTPKAVVAVDLFGLPADYKAIKPVCEKYGLLLMEDAAQGFGGSIDGKMACSFGDISTTSFFPAKPLGCYGDGGAIFTDNDEWAEYLRSICVHGKSANDKYNNVRIGMNSRLDTLQAAVLLPKLKAFADYELDDVNKAASWYDEALKDTCLTLPLIPEGFRSSWAQYTVQLPEGVVRSDLQAALKAEDIPTMVYYPKPMHLQGAFEGTDSADADCSVTECLCKTVLSLPMHPYLRKEDVETVAEMLKKYLAK